MMAEQEYQQFLLQPRQQLHCQNMSDVTILELWSLLKACNLQGRLGQQSAVNFSQLELLAAEPATYPHFTLNCTSEQAEERIDELEDRTIEIIKSEEQKRKSTEPKGPVGQDQTDPHAQRESKHRREGGQRLHTSEHVKWYSHCEKQYGGSSKITNNYPTIQQFRFWVYTQKNK